MRLRVFGSDMRDDTILCRNIVDEDAIYSLGFNELSLSQHAI